jgi:multimeric flavodoxin WrbA
LGKIIGIVMVLILKADVIVFGAPNYFALCL